jgi:hypothetical protein
MYVFRTLWWPLARLAAASGVSMAARRAGTPSRFEQGNATTLRALKSRVQELAPRMEVIIVQPGVSKASASDEQLELLAVTDLCLRETFAVPLRLIAST